MLIEFSEAELKSLIIQPVPRRETATEYRAERERVWATRLAEVQAHNNELWNGEVYTLEDLAHPGEEQVIFQMSTCEYKDLIFGLVSGWKEVTARHGSSHLFRFCGVNCAPVTSDGKFVFGIRADRPDQGAPVGGIGGTLNKDEMEIHCFADIRRHMLHEIEEESALECRLEDLRFVGLYYALNSYQFWFTVRLGIHSSEVPQYHRPGEFASLFALTQEEALAVTRPTSRAFRRWLPYLGRLESLLNGE